MNSPLLTVEGAHGASQESSQQKAPVIEITALAKTFRSRSGVVRAVDGIDLSIDRGEVVALLGHNGAGKTTTLDIVLGFTAPTSGECRVFGAAPRTAVRAGLVGGVLQSDALLDDLTVGETVAMVATQHADPIPAQEALDRAGAAGFAARRVSKCSGGERQRLRFALALLADPELLVLDEPTAGMDVSARRDFWAAMHAETERGRTIVFATHYLAEAEEFADRTVVMRRGHIVADGTTAQVRAMGGTRMVSCRWDDRDGDPSGLPGVAEVRRTNGRIALYLFVGGAAGGATDGEPAGSPSDVLARHLLTHTRARDVLIEEARLEDAFIGLTEADPTNPTNPTNPAKPVTRPAVSRHPTGSVPPPDRA